MAEIKVQMAPGSKSSGEGENQDEAEGQGNGMEDKTSQLRMRGEMCGDWGLQETDMELSQGVAHEGSSMCKRDTLYARNHTGSNTVDVSFKTPNNIL